MGPRSPEALEGVPEGELRRYSFCRFTHTQVLLELWSTSSDNVRIASFLAVRKTFVAGDDSLKDLCLKVNNLAPTL